MQKYHSKVIAAFLALMMVGGICSGFKTTASAASVSEKENNNTTTTANTVTIGDSVSGNISTNDDVDYYKITLSKAGNLSIKFTSYIEYYSLFIYDSDGREVWNSKGNKWVAEAGRITNTHPVDLGADTYYIKTTGTEYYGGRHTGSYSFVLSFVSADENLSEPNQSITNASSTNFNATIKGLIAVNDEVDYTMFTLPTSGRISIKFTSEINYYSLYVLDVDGHEIWKSKGNSWVAESKRVTNTHVLDLLAGLYYLKIEGTEYYGGKHTGKYSYIITFSDAKENISEQNNSIPNAAIIGLNQSVKGQIAVNDESDYCEFSLSATDSIKIEMKSWIEYYSLYLYDEDGKELWKSKGNKYNSNTGYIENTHTVDLNAGTYYLKIEGTEYYGGKHTGNYQFTITGKNPVPTVTVTYNTNGGSPANWTETANANSTYTVTTTTPTKSYKLTYNANGGSVSPASKTLNCTFGGWKTGSYTYQSGASYSLGGSNVTFTAQWTNPKAGSLPNATRSGYTFDGWYTAASGGTEVTDSTVISQNTTIYAHWTPVIPDPVPVPGKGTITVGTVKGKQGDTVKVPVSVSGNPGMSVFEMQFSFDTARLKLKGISKDSSFGGNLAYSSKITWFNTSETKYNGTMFYLTFEILKTAKDGEAKVSITNCTAYNWQEKAVSFNLTAGKVNVQTYMPGDINNDGKVNISDLLRLLKYISGENVTVVQAALDVNGDGKVNISDLLRLLKYISGENVVIH